MEPGDIPTVVAIDRLSFPTPWSPSSYLYELNHRNSSFYYVLLRPRTDEPARSREKWHQWLRTVTGLPQPESRVIGYVGFRRHGAGTHISTIAVHPDWQGNGLGEFLLLMVMEQSLDLHAEEVSLEVRASNRIAQHLYQKYGFHFTGVHPGYYRDGEDAWLMAADLRHSAYRRRLSKLHHALEARVQQFES